MARLPLATREGESRGKCLIGKELFSAGQILVQVPAICGCVEREAEGDGEQGIKLWAAPECHGVIVSEWAGWGCATV